MCLCVCVEEEGGNGLICTGVLFKYAFWLVCLSVYIFCLYEYIYMNMLTSVYIICYCLCIFACVNVCLDVFVRVYPFHLYFFTPH